jgi:hypothetical protein
MLGPEEGGQPSRANDKGVVVTPLKRDSRFWHEYLLKSSYHAMRLALTTPRQFHHPSTVEAHNNGHQAEGKKAIRSLPVRHE